MRFSLLSLIATMMVAAATYVSAIPADPIDTTAAVQKYDVECTTSNPDFEQAAQIKPFHDKLFGIIKKKYPVMHQFTDPGRTPKTFFDRVDCCQMSGVFFTNHNITEPILLTGAEVVLMAEAVIAKCQQWNRAKGRAWDKDRTFTVEVSHWECLHWC